MENNSEHNTQTLPTSSTQNQHDAESRQCSNNTDLAVTLEDRVQLFRKELDNREYEIELLIEISNAVSSELNLEKVFQLVAERARVLIQSDTLLIPIIKEDCSEYIYQAGCGKNAEEIVGESLPLELGVCGWVWKHKRPWWKGVLDELDEEERNRWEKEAGTIIMVPLVGKRHLLGGIAGIDKIGGGDFSKRDLDLLTLFANQVVVAIENATFFEELNHSKMQAETYHQELQTLNVDLEKRVIDRTAALTEINDKLRQEIDEHRQTEYKLGLYMNKLEKSNQELQDFAHVASHDLQEPLRKVTAFGDRLKSKCAEQLNDQGLDYLERMQSAAGRMHALINGLLSFSRVTTKAIPFTTTDLSTVVQEVLSDLEVRIEETRAKVEIGELPTIEADPLQMRQLMQNLIGNALKFNRTGETPIVNVRQRAHSEKGKESETMGSDASFFQIIVEDNGIGFDNKYTERIFNVFQRLHGRKEYEGTGIGLSVCKKIVERHGGNITATSEPGQGASFIITLPFHQHKE